MPPLCSRLASCIHHDPVVASRLKHHARHYLGQLWYDAVAYGSEELEFVARVAQRGKQFNDPASSRGSINFGVQRILFGTDFPFFPPLESENNKWLSVTENLAAIDGIPNWSEKEKQAVKGDNALNLFRLHA